MRGYCGIGIENFKKIHNIGTLFRSAFALGANFVFTVGMPYEQQCSDTLKAWRHIPYWRFDDWEDFHRHIPYDCQLVGVEITPDAHALENFVHPERAVYLLGSEDNGISPKALAGCQYVVKIASSHCLNVAAAGTVVLYDRQAKLTERHESG